MTAYDVHPIAALFPMLAEEELIELAADIKERGQLQPIVLDRDRQILDGRNRLAACEIAGVEPFFTLYEGDDPGGYAFSVNIRRRHLSTGQQAMIAAKARVLEPNTSQSALARDSGLNRTRIVQAVAVLQHAPDLADDVAVGRYGLDAAYADALKRKQEIEDRTRRLEGLRQEFADLAEKIAREELSVEGALEIAADRLQHIERQHREEEDRKRRNSTALAVCVSYAFNVLLNPESRATIAGLYEHSLSSDPFKVTRAALKRAAENISHLAEEWET